MKLTLAITTYNRPDMTMKAFEKVIDNPQIDEIVIIDDCSTMENYKRLIDLCAKLSMPDKIRIFRNKENKGCYHNKREAIEKASNEWVILFDSDNVMDIDYLNPLSKYQLNHDTIYAPDFGRPHFDYTAFSNILIDRSNVAGLMDRKGFDCLINTCNYTVNRSEYLRVWINHKEPWTADSLFYNYNWFAAGNKMQVVGGMSYMHLIHDGSHYKEHVSKTGNMYNEYMIKLKRL